MVALVVAVLGVALGTSAPSLGVAEFAPSAQQSLDAPPTTAGSDGIASGAGRRRPTTTTTVPTSTATDAGGPSASPTSLVGRGRQCYGDPPRQIEDLLSPPCIATIFEGENGGATARGVTATEIRVAIPYSQQDDEWTKAVLGLFDYVNSRFEFYGRRLVPVFVQGFSWTGLEARANAADIASKNMFAALTGLSEAQYGQAALPAELGRQGIVTVTYGATTWWTDQALYETYHPYVWSVYPSSEDQQANLAELACKALAGRPASHAADADLRGKTRRFGIVRSGVENIPNVSRLARALEACTGEAPVQYGVSDKSSYQDHLGGMERFRAAGVTTAICVCEGFGPIGIFSSASSNKLYPEWVMTPSASSAGDESRLQLIGDPKLLSSIIRLDAGPRLVPVQVRPWYRALKTQMEQTKNLRSTVKVGEYVYGQMLVLASGIQAAGPALTADTFARALMTLPFPNPGAGRPPVWQPSVGFGPGDHSFYDDYLLGWWSNDAAAIDNPLSANPKGSWCYVQQGARFGPGAYPADADSKLFNRAEPCR